MAMKNTPIAVSIRRTGSASSVAAPSAPAGAPVAAKAQQLRQSTSFHQATTRETLAITAAIAMIGTACSGPKAITSTGISMIEEPKPTMPESVPATRPRQRMKTNSKARRILTALSAPGAALDWPHDRARAAAAPPLPPRTAAPRS